MNVVSVTPVTGGVSVVYTVTYTNPVDTVTASAIASILQSTATTASITSSLQSAGFTTASVQTPTSIVDISLTRSPTFAPTPSSPLSLLQSQGRTLCSIGTDAPVSSSAPSAWQVDGSCTVASQYTISSGVPSWCKWTGVYCDSISYTVTRLDMLSYSQGTISTSIGSLTSLKALMMDSSSLFGPIPSEIWQLTQLTSLNVTHSAFFGTIPSSIASLSLLKRLELSHTSIAGTIPSAIGTLTSLSYLWLPYNSLTGTVPKSFSQLTNLHVQTFSVDYNYLSGFLPGWLMTSFSPIISRPNIGEFVL